MVFHKLLGSNDGAGLKREKVGTRWPIYLCPTVHCLGVNLWPAVLCAYMGFGKSSYTQLLDISWAKMILCTKMRSTYVLINETGVDI